MAKWKKPRSEPYVPDEVRDAEAIVAFYEKRLDEAYERLGQVIEEANQKALRRERGLNGGGLGAATPQGVAGASAAR